MTNIDETQLFIYEPGDRTLRLILCGKHAEGHADLTKVNDGAWYTYEEGCDVCNGRVDLSTFKLKQPPPNLKAMKARALEDLGSFCPTFGAPEVLNLVNYAQTLERALMDLGDGNYQPHEIKSQTGLDDERCRKISELISTLLNR